MSLSPDRVFVVARNPEADSKLPYLLWLLKGTETPIRSVSRSFFEFARPAAPPRPRWRIQTVHRARHLFPERCQGRMRLWWRDLRR